MQADMRPTLCFVVSAPITINAFLQEPIKLLAKDFKIFVACNGTAQDIALPIRQYLTVLPVEIRRAISLQGDLIALWKLIWMMRRYKFDVVHSITPKAGLLAMLSSYLAGVKTRIHTFTGQVWVTRGGLGRWLLKSMDRVIAYSATHILVDSRSQLQFLLAERVVSVEKSAVLASGSISGVDVNRFYPNAKVRGEVRRDLRLPHEAIVFLFLGRLNLDKGVLDIAAAFRLVAYDYPNAYLLVVGPDEGKMALAMQELAGEHANKIRFVGYTDRPEAYMAAADVFCLPSYREGFGSVIIEAAAAGLPAIGSRIYGISDAIDDGKTGLLHPPGDIAAIHACMSTFTASPERITTMGQQARARAVSDFASPALACAWLAFYREIQ
ncbi:MAG: glycosyltransferase family 4 protein [Gallionella sp.]|nr:glycosyltransferase family 4 protein [Gallionella sp.]